MCAGIQWCEDADHLRSYFHHFEQERCARRHLRIEPGRCAHRHPCTHHPRLQRRSFPHCTTFLIHSDKIVGNIFIVYVCIYVALQVADLLHKAVQIGLKIQAGGAKLVKDFEIEVKKSPEVCAYVCMTQDINYSYYYV
jgi:hypothetical protein